VTVALGIVKADPRDAVFREPLARHVAAADDQVGPEFNFALEADALAAPGIEFWAAWQGGQLAGFIALKHLNPREGEVKSMRVLDPFLGQGIGQRLLDQVISASRRAGHEAVWLETGRLDSYSAARHLYRRAGFVETGPFGDYPDAEASLFMRLDLIG